MFNGGKMSKKNMPPIESNYQVKRFIHNGFLFLANTLT
jgi:hypothetical protein